MGSLLVGAAGLMWERVAGAGLSPGGGLGASRLLPWETVGRGRQRWRFAPAALGDCGVVMAASVLCACCLGRLLAWGESRSNTFPQK